jgi:hypothetical protein
MSHIVAKLGEARAAEQAILTELLADLRRQTSTMESLAGQTVNHVLEVATAPFPTDGYITRNYHVAAGSIEVQTNGHPVTVVTAGPSSSAPDRGVGVYVIPAGTCRQINLASRVVTMYGTADDWVSFQVVTVGATSAGRMA